MIKMTSLQAAQAMSNSVSQVAPTVAIIIGIAILVFAGVSCFFVNSNYKRLRIFKSGFIASACMIPIAIVSAFNTVMVLICIPFVGIAIVELLKITDIFEQG